MTIEELQNHEFYIKLKKELKILLPNIEITERLVPPNKHPMFKIGDRKEPLASAHGDGFDILFNERTINFYLYEEVILSTDDSKEEFNELLKLCLDELPNRVKKYGV